MLNYILWSWHNYISVSALIQEGDYPGITGYTTTIHSQQSHQQDWSLKMFQQATEVLWCCLSYYVAVKLPEESSNGTVMCSPNVVLPSLNGHRKSWASRSWGLGILSFWTEAVSLPCPLSISKSSLKKTSREDFRRPGVLSFWTEAVSLPCPLSIS